MSETIPDDNENPEYKIIRERFEASFAASDYAGNFRDDAFIADAIKVMCIEALNHPSDTPLSKATRAIAARLMGSPEMRKEWLVTFPYVWSSKESALSPGEVKRRGVAFKVWKKNQAGTLVTHAIAEVATALHVSPQKVTKDYYDWKNHLDRIGNMSLDKEKSSKNSEPEKE